MLIGLVVDSDGLAVDDSIGVLVLDWIVVFVGVVQYGFDDVECFVDVDCFVGFVDVDWVVDVVKYGFVDVECFVVIVVDTLFCAVGDVDAVVLQNLRSASLVVAYCQLLFVLSPDSF